MKEIDLDKIIDEHLGNGFNPLQKQATRFVMRKGIEQALDMASEEADMIIEHNYTRDKECSKLIGNGQQKIRINKDSILDIKNRIK